MYCKICGKKLTSNDLWLNRYLLCKRCILFNVAKSSIKRSKEKYLK